VQGGERVEGDGRAGKNRKKETEEKENGGILRANMREVSEKINQEGLRGEKEKAKGGGAREGKKGVLSLQMEDAKSSRGGRGE